MEEATESNPKPERKGEGAASAARPHLVPQRNFEFPPVSDNRSVATLPRSWLGNSLSPAYRIPLSAGSRRRHNESLPANRKNRQWTDRRKRALVGSRKLSRRGTKGSPARPGLFRREEDHGWAARNRSDGSSETSRSDTSTEGTEQRHSCVGPIAPYRREQPKAQKGERQQKTTGRRHRSPELERSDATGSGHEVIPQGRALLAPTTTLVAALIYTTRTDMIVLAQTRTCNRSQPWQTIPLRRGSVDKELREILEYSFDLDNVHAVSLLLPPWPEADMQGEGTRAFRSHVTRWAENRLKVRAAILDNRTDLQTLAHLVTAVDASVEALNVTPFFAVDLVAKATNGELEETDWQAAEQSARAQSSCPGQTQATLFWLAASLFSFFDFAPSSAKVEEILAATSRGNEGLHEETTATTCIKTAAWYIKKIRRARVPGLGRSDDEEEWIPSGGCSRCRDTIKLTRPFSSTVDGGAFERVCRFCDDPHDVRHCGRALALYRPPCPERTTRLKMEMERFEVYVDIPARCGRWCSMKTISAATKFRCTPQPLAPSTPRTAALPLVSDLQTPFSLQNSRSKSSVPVSDYAQADPSSGKSKSGKKHTPSRRMERVRRGMAKLSIRPGHERANGGLSASPSASSGRSERNLSHSDLSLSGEDSEFRGTERSSLLASIIQRTIHEPLEMAEDGAMQTENSSGVGSDLPTSEVEFPVLAIDPPFQTSTPVESMDLPTSEYENFELIDDAPLQTHGEASERDPLRTDVPNDSESDEAWTPTVESAPMLSFFRLTMDRTGEEAPGDDKSNRIKVDAAEASDDDTQKRKGGPFLSGGHDVLNITPPQSELNEAMRNVQIKGVPLRAATPLAAHPDERDHNPIETAARTRPRPPQCNERKLIKVRDGGYNAANDDVVRSGRADRLGQTEAPLTAYSRVVTGTIAGRKIEFLVDSGCSFSTITEDDLAALQNAVPKEVWKYTAWYDEAESAAGSGLVNKSEFKNHQVVIIIVQLGALGGFSAPFVVDQSDSPRTALGHNVQRELGMTLTTQCDLCTREGVCLQGTFQDADASIGRACIAARQERVEPPITDSRHPFRLGVARQ